MFNYKNHITSDGNVIFHYDSLLPEFDARKEKDIIVRWIERTFRQTGGKTAVVGVSGGKDSSVVAALCVEALGADNVIAVKMPYGTQHDIDCANRLIAHLGIKSIEYDISPVVSAFEQEAAEICIATPGWTLPSDNDVPEDAWSVPESNKRSCREAAEEDDSGIYMNAYELPDRAAINLLPRVRLCVLYMIAQTLRDSARVVGTANLSEAFIGWDTRYGGAGASGADLLPIANYTATEVRALGYMMGLPDELLDKAPEDGLTGKTDEEAFGFSYAELDLYIRIGRHATLREDVMDAIDAMHARNEFKLRMPPACFTDLRVLA